MLVAGFAGGPASSQGLLNRSSGPVAIDADEGIEWRRDEKVYIATGNAKAVRGDVTVTAHRLIAYYRERNPTPSGSAKPAAGASDAKEPEGGASSTDIYRLVAETDVTIQTPTQRATGDHGVYDVDRGVLVLTGNHLALDTSQDHITARDSLEYWDERKIAVARGDGVMVRADRRIQGDVLTAHIAEDKKTNESHITEVDGFGNVRISTPTQIAQGAKGVYNLVTNIAYLVDAVRVTQGKNQLNGDYGEVNLNTNVSRMLSGPSAGRPGQRVRSLIVPNQGEAPAPTAAPTPRSRS
jgi:lipopolysaccharide export system protein LptA